MQMTKMGMYGLLPQWIGQRGHGIICSNEYLRRIYSKVHHNTSRTCLTHSIHCAFVSQDSADKSEATMKSVSCLTY